METVPNKLHPLIAGARRRGLLARAGRDTRCEISVRFEDGTTRVLSQDSEPAWRTRDRVRVTSGIIGAA